MALFNKKTVNQKTINLAGGEAFKMSPELQMASVLLTSFAQDQFYRKANDTFTELIALLPKVSPEFAAKAAIYARTEFGMRSITHFLAAELAAHLSGKEWAKSFFDRIVYRPDDMLEIAAYYFANGGKTLPNAMKKGFAAAFDRFDGYQLAKYRGENRSVKLIDLVNLVHPVPTLKNAKALQELVKGELKNSGTWESKLSEAGQKAETEEEKADLKAEAWEELIRTNKLGYFALLRNLRNIAGHAPQFIDEVCRMLVNPNAIAKSLVLPFRYLSAMDAIAGLDAAVYRKLAEAINKAIEISLKNVPQFEGRTLVVLDDSGSMTSGTVKGMNRRPIEIGALFAAVLYKSNNADLMTFSDQARYHKINPADSVASISQALIKMAASGGTNFHAIFHNANKAYDRIIILSDMQGWVGYYNPAKEFEVYKNRFGANPYIYSVDLQGYSTLQFPERKVFAMAGFSEKVFDLMNMLEKDPKALVNSINNIEF